MAQLDHLRRVIQVAQEIRGIHDDHNQGRGRKFGQAIEEHVPRDLLVEGLRAQAVCSRQIQHAHFQALRRVKELSFLALNCDAGVITHFGAQPGQRVEQGGLAAIRIARQRHIWRGWGALRALSCARLCGRLGAGRLSLRLSGGSGTHEAIRWHAQKFARPRACAESNCSPVPLFPLGRLRAQIEPTPRRCRQANPFP